VLIQGFTIIPSADDIEAGIYLWCNNHNITIKNNIIANFSSEFGYDDTYYGIIVDPSPRECKIINNNITNNRYGIYLYAADDVFIENCNIYNNSYEGIYLSSSDNVCIESCNIYNNSNYGIYMLYSDDVSIKYCSIYNHAYNGIYLTKSYDTKIKYCNIYNNMYGLRGYDVYRMYASRSTFFKNTYRGIYLYKSMGAIINCNFSNNYYGIYLSYSNVNIRFSRIEQNSEYGVYNYGYIVNATHNWWGDISGPYHSSQNPSGTGDRVSNDVNFDPWQTELYQPKAVIGDLICSILSAQTNTVYYVPTGNIYDDSAFYAFYSFKGNPQIIAPPTQSSASNAYLDEDGRPLFTGDIVTFGGRFANRMVRYYEDAGIALVGYGWDGTSHLFTRISDGSHLYAIEDSTYNATEKDYFVFQIYKDEDMYVFSEWGICAEGTYAGGTCFIDIIYPNLYKYTNQYYIFSWTDSNNDNMPQPEEITLETSGS